MIRVNTIRLQLKLRHIIILIMKKIMQKLIILTSILSSAFLVNAEEINNISQYYIGYEIGVSKVNAPSSYQGSSITNVDDTHDNSRLFIGKNFHESIAIELGHFEGGRYAWVVLGAQGASSYNLIDIVFLPSTTSKVMLVANSKLLLPKFK